MLHKNRWGKLNAQIQNRDNWLGNITRDYMVDHINQQCVVVREKKQMQFWVAVTEALYAK